MLSQEFPGKATPPAYANYFFWRLSITSATFFSLADATYANLQDYLIATLALIAFAAVGCTVFEFFFAAPRNDDDTVDGTKKENSRGEDLSTASVELAVSGDLGVTLLS
jgi:hypothetical protein